MSYKHHLPGHHSPTRWSLVIPLICHVVVGILADSESQSFRSLFFREPDHQLSSVAGRQFSDTTVDECAEECVKETSFNCKGFDFVNSRRACILYSVSNDDKDVHLIASTGVDHYRTTYVRLFHHLPNHILTNTHNARIDQVSVEECARRCILETTFKCRGFDFEGVAQTCWLTVMTPELAGGVRVARGWEYYERIPEGPLARFVHYGFGRMRLLQGSDVYSKSVMDVPLDACATLCLAETTFHCLSIDYIKNDDGRITCHLSRFIAANVYGLVSSHDTRSMHFERKDKYLARFYPTPYAIVIGNNHKEYSRVTPERCARNCLEEGGFVCRSFDYKIHDGTCLLSSKTGSDVGGLYKQNLHEIHHFELKPILDCGGNLTEDMGDLASPNWPRNYAHHENCVWHVMVSQHKVIRFRFTHLDLGIRFHDPCSEREDRVIITEQSTASPADYSVVPGNSLTPNSFCVLPNTRNFLTHSNRAAVTFLTNGHGDGQGFRVFYSAEWPCDVLLTKAPGEFASPNYPDNYPPSTTCSWRITAPENLRVRVRINSLELEQHTLGHCNERYDHLLVLDGGTVKAPRIGLYCGTREPFTVRSTKRDIFIQFKSDGEVTLPGFHAFFDFESQNGTIVDVVQTDDDGVEPLEEDEIHDDNNSVYLGQPGIGKRLSDPVAAATHQYGTKMWAIVATLLLLLVAACIIIFLLWRKTRGHQDEVIHEADYYEEVPMHNPAVCSAIYIKPNNEEVPGPEEACGSSSPNTATGGAASAISKDCDDMTTLLYKPNNLDEENKSNLKNVNLDSKC